MLSRHAARLVGYPSPQRTHSGVATQMTTMGPTPVIENCEPNFRKGSEAEIQIETLPQSTG